MEQGMKHLTSGRQVVCCGLNLFHIQYLLKTISIFVQIEFILNFILWQTLCCYCLSVLLPYIMLENIEILLPHESWGQIKLDHFKLHPTTMNLSPSLYIYLISTPDKNKQIIERSCR